MIDLPKTFETYLLTEGSSRITIKNYLSDLNHFLAWFELFLRSQNSFFSPFEPEYLSKYFNSDAVKRYASYMQANSIPSSTINRRFSALRSFAKFCLSQGWVRENPTKGLLNQSKRAREQESKRDEREKEAILRQFNKFLEEEKTTAGRLTSSNTIKNYLSDIRKFLSWLETETVS